MRRTLLLALALVQVVAGCAATPNDPERSPTQRSTSWDVAVVAQTIDAARRARLQGDLTAAERLCYSAFESVSRSALSSYDDYVAVLTAENRAEATTMRARAERLHAIKAQHTRSTEPTSTYLGFSPAQDLKAYADILEAHARSDEARRIRSLALAYQQVQQAHFQRAMLFREGKDPRGSC